MRPIDLGRVVGLGAQAVREYEGWGVLPPAARDAHGWRVYEERHVRALMAALAMRRGYGWGTMLAIMRLQNTGQQAAALARVDACHAELDRARADVTTVLTMLRAAASAGSAASGAAADGPGLRISAAADAVGAKTSALRFWEAQGLIAPDREPGSSYRRYRAKAMQQVRIVAALRRTGYDFPAIRLVLAEVTAGNVEVAITTAEARLSDLTGASRRCLEATAAFAAYLAVCSEAADS